jgi:DNA polymerase-3 subunit delta'
MFENFYGNAAAADALARMISRKRIHQTILLAGPEGIGKATLARRFAAALLGGAGRIETDDLSLPHNAAIVADREKWAADKRVQEPLFFAGHPDFLTFPPDGPLRQISIQQMRLLKDRAQYLPLHGQWRVFLIDHIDRANEQAANSLLKTLEEPPPYLVLLMTARNPYDLLPTIRSRAVPVQLSRLSEEEMTEFVRARGLSDPERRIALADGSPGLALSLDLEAWDKRRAAMLALLKVSLSQAPFSLWAAHSEKIGASRSERLDAYLDVMYSLLEDLLAVATRRGASAAVVRNIDLRREYDSLAPHASFAWLARAVGKVDEMAGLLRRNIQKSIALDAFAVSLRQP